MTASTSTPSSAVARTETTETTETTEPPTAPVVADTSGSGRHAMREPPELRGATTIADRVVEAMARAIVGEVDHVGGAARRLLGVHVAAEDADAAVRVHAEVRGGIVTLRVRCSVMYPAPVARVTERVRHQLTQRIAALTGLQVRRVEITVTALHSPHEPTAREALQ